MRILIVRHGDPDYAIDGLTKKGKREVQLLADKLAKEDIKAMYCSPLGRARLTAQPTADRLGLEVKVCNWLREFDVASIRVPYLDEPKCPWDLLPEFVNTKENIYSPTLWKTEDFIANSGVAAYYDEVTAAFDALIAEHGYVRDGYNYKAVKPNHDTIAIVCHYGLESVLLSHVMNCSPYTLWQNLVALTTSVTTIHTEERREGIASMRICGIGDISHLYAGNEEPAFAARFCECFTDDTRHD